MSAFPNDEVIAIEWARRTANSVAAALPKDDSSWDTFTTVRVEGGADDPEVESFVTTYTFYSYAKGGLKGRAAAWDAALAFSRACLGDSNQNCYIAPARYAPFTIQTASTTSRPRFLGLSSEGYAFAKVGIKLTWVAA